MADFTHRQDQRPQTPDRRVEPYAGRVHRIGAPFVGSLFPLFLNDCSQWDAKRPGHGVPGTAGTVSSSATASGRKPFTIR
jgi:hypothetical protein